MRIKILTGNARKIGLHERLLVAVQVLDTPPGGGAEAPVQGEPVMLRSDDAEAFADADTNRPYREKKTTSRGTVDFVFVPRKASVDPIELKIELNGPAGPIAETVEVTVEDQGIAAVHHVAGAAIVQTTGGQTFVTGAGVPVAPCAGPTAGRVIFIGPGGVKVLGS